jgi:hypothetical protein
VPVVHVWTRLTRHRMRRDAEPCSCFLARNRGIVTATVER